MPDAVSGAFVELRASTDKLKGDLTSAIGAVRSAGFGGLGSKVGIGALVGGALAIDFNALAGALQRFDPKGGQLNNLKSQLSETRDLLGDLNFMANAAGKGLLRAFGLGAKGLDSLNEKLRFARNIASLDPILGRFIGNKLIPQSGQVGTAIGNFRFADNQQQVQNDLLRAILEKMDMLNQTATGPRS